MASNKMISILALCAVVGETFLSFGGRGGRTSVLLKPSAQWKKNSLTRYNRLTDALRLGFAFKCLALCC